MNARTQERLTQQVLLNDPDALVERAMSLLFSPVWADLVVGIAVCTGRNHEDGNLHGQGTVYGLV